MYLKDDKAVERLEQPEMLCAHAQLLLEAYGRFLDNNATPAVPASTIEFRDRIVRRADPIRRQV